MNREPGYFQSLIGAVSAIDQVNQNTYAAATYLSQMRGEGPSQCSDSVARSVEDKLAEARRWLDRAERHFTRAMDTKPRDLVIEGVRKGLEQGRMRRRQAASQPPPSVRLIAENPTPHRIPDTRPEHPGRPPSA